MDLFKVSLICSLIGILIIIAVAERSEFPLSNIEGIDEGMVEKEVRINGKITSIYETGNVSLITVEDQTGNVPVVVFSDLNFNLKEGDYVEVVGEVMLYNDLVEINADLIKVI